MSSWLRDNRLMVVTASIGVVVAVAAVLAVVMSGDGEEPLPEPATSPTEPEEPEATEEEPEPEPELVRLPLTGVEVEEDPDRPALIVKVSNSPEARPQTGLADADVVVTQEMLRYFINSFRIRVHSPYPNIFPLFVKQNSISCLCLLFWNTLQDVRVNRKNRQCDIRQPQLLRLALRQTLLLFGAHNVELGTQFFAPLCFCGFGFFGPRR
jgi:hypothetical protein